MNFLAKVMKIFKVCFGPLLFIKIILKTAQLLSKHFPFGLFFCIRRGHRMYVKRGVLRNFSKFTGKHLGQSLFFNKVTGLEFCKISKNTFSTEHLLTNASVVSFISFFIKARTILQFFSLVFSNLYMFSRFSFVFITASITST